MPAALFQGHIDVSMPATILNANAGLLEPENFIVVASAFAIHLPTPTPGKVCQAASQARKTLNAADLAKIMSKRLLPIKFLGSQIRGSSSTLRHPAAPASCSFRLWDLARAPIPSHRDSIPGSALLYPRSRRIGFPTCPFVSLLQGNISSQVLPMAFSVWSWGR